MLLLKSQRKFICKSCVLAKCQDFPALLGELDTILATQRKKLSSDSTGPTANTNNAVHSTVRDTKYQRQYWPKRANTP